MRLSEEQQDFARDIAKLIQFINRFDNGRYSCTLGDAYRSPICHGAWGEKKAYGKAKSNHKRRLALDLNLFKDGVYQEDSEAHRPFADFWESLHPHNRSGIRFDDANHYERVWNGWR